MLPRFSRITFSVGILPVILALALHFVLRYRNASVDANVPAGAEYDLFNVLVALALAMMGAVFVITDVLFGSHYASVAAGLIAAFFLYAWVRCAYPVPSEGRVALREPSNEELFQTGARGGPGTETV